MAAEPVVRPGWVQHPADRAGLARLRWAWRIAAGEEPATDKAAFVASFGDWCLAHAESHRPHIALVDGAYVGMAWLAVVERVPGPSSWPRLSGYVQSTYVADAHREQGIGSAIVRSLIDDAQDLGLDYLAVHPSEPAMDFYARLGFARYDRALELRW